MNDTNSNLEYVSSVLQKADSRCVGEPSIYVLWGVIVFVGYTFAEYWVEYTTLYWMIACVIGGLASWWLGERACKKMGQGDKVLGLQFGKLGLIMCVFSFTAVFTQEYLAILLLIGMAYCLAAVFLDKIMYLAGVASWLAYVGVSTGIITNAMVVGGAIALAFFVSAWSSARARKNLSNDSKAS